MGGNRHCFVPGCRSNYPSGNKKIKLERQQAPSLFKVPKESLEVWRREIPTKHRPLTERDKVCEYHFVSDDIERYFTRITNSNEKVILQRDRPLLKKGAVPCIFPNMPCNVTKVSGNTKLLQNISTNPNCLSPNQGVPAPFPIASYEEVVATSSTCVGDIAIQLDEPSLENIQEALDYEFLTQNISNVQLPSSLWAWHNEPSQNFLSIIQVSPKTLTQGVIDKAILFERSCIPKIFFRGALVEDSVTPMNDAYDITCLIEKVNAIVLCSGIDMQNSQFSPKCSIILTPKRLASTSRCEACAQRRKFTRKQAPKIKPENILKVNINVQILGIE